jgi:hypothetical protein
LVELRGKFLQQEYHPDLINKQFARALIVDRSAVVQDVKLYRSNLFQIIKEETKMKKL